MGGVWKADRGGGGLFWPTGGGGSFRNGLMRSLRGEQRAILLKRKNLKKRVKNTHTWKKGI